MTSEGCRKIMRRAAFRHHSMATLTFSNGTACKRQKTHGEGLLPAGPHYGGSDDADVELALLLLHHVLRQGFGVGVGVGPVADEARRDVPHDAVVHPPGGREFNTRSEKRGI